ncbi:tRNA lysidine(34) synthetase TilS [Mycoplasma nasistruthionis]|uniref:tRNA(Ile)-lysidine synthase n=1 Tax=Mycoplasma nasistruthionis TaxID=353852 RepID=A0A5B7XWC7_9MOLU|nr:tRNA lysidine(34) synthetase TilS [Mycoplasma nasistruthionis]QCZ36890.1 tRNA lysidine(34) synthetase TilS [Mycoplasma nasistruthionis]
MKKYLLAISGGPDSMYLLNKYKNKDIVVAHVNYGIREDAELDTKIVSDFCIKNNIKFEILRLQKTDFKTGNFQDWAREQRYDFFKRIYKKYNCQTLLTAHHLDDFFETAMMQKNSQRKALFFGIKQKNIIKNMIIERPLIKMFKSQILRKCIKYQIPFNDDYTNFQTTYQRNIIRMNYKNKFIQKNSKFGVLNLETFFWKLKKNKFKNNF